ncbi:uncharacterized protein AB675_2654 [Cyphellophora attinorum]|uniref:Uncharacterized protein n=1 Tax=Cyphellophora attinorum TaxID=1664694 RepID=A0A0N1P1F5_9EURO|nr:uncharacterized protein AB675_2654 [Phialophora attinorum]KPI45094.1 hypothetical protein AB675_2654 [Phialophora attinorum]
MSAASRGARALARSLRQPTRVQTRRYASHGDSHGHGGSSGSAYDAPSGATGSESFGPGFYVAVAAIPLFYISYQLASDPGNFMDKFVSGFSTQEVKRDNDRNNVHAAMLQQLIDDKFILKTTPRGEGGPPIRFIEGLNGGSQLNVSASAGATDLSALIKHQLEEREKREQERMSEQNTKYASRGGIAESTGVV